MLGWCFMNTFPLGFLQKQTVFLIRWFPGVLFRINTSLRTGNLQSPFSSSGYKTWNLHCIEMMPMSWSPKTWDLYRVPFCKAYFPHLFKKRNIHKCTNKLTVKCKWLLGSQFITSHILLSKDHAQYSNATPKSHSKALCTLGKSF